MIITPAFTEAKPLYMYLLQLLCAYVIRFRKMCIVHTSNFSNLMTHKIYLKWWIDVKLSGIVVLLFLYHPGKFHICIPFRVVFMILQMSKIGCVNYVRFPKSGHIYVQFSQGAYIYKIKQIKYKDYWYSFFGFRSIPVKHIPVKQVLFC